MLKTVSSIISNPSFFFSKKKKLGNAESFFSNCEEMRRNFIAGLPPYEPHWRVLVEILCFDLLSHHICLLSSQNHRFWSFFSNSEERKCDLGEVQSLLWPHFIVLVEILCFGLLSQDILLFCLLKVHLGVFFSNSEQMWCDLGTRESLLWPFRIILVEKIIFGSLFHDFRFFFCKN